MSDKSIKIKKKKYKKNKKDKKNKKHKIVVSDEDSEVSDTFLPIEPIK